MGLSWSENENMHEKIMMSFEQKYLLFLTGKDEVVRAIKLWQLNFIVLNKIVNVYS